MRRRITLLASCLVLAAAQAQSVPPAPQPSDSWSRPAPAASVDYRTGAAPASADDPHTTHFKFKERGMHPLLPGNAAQERSGKAPVGIGTVDSNGRPAVNCPQTPMDPACH
jgi:hypothetical protein